MRSILLSAAVSIVISLSVARSARAAALAFDSAADPAYASYRVTGAPVTGVNGGYGWGPWEEMYSYAGVLSVSSNPHLLAINTNGFWLQNPVTAAGATWEIPGVFDSPIARLEIRQLDGSLAVGQTLSFDFDNVPAIGILSPDGMGATYEIIPGNPDRVWFTQPSEGFFPTDVNDTIEGGHISITPIDADQATMSIISYGPLGGTESLELPYADVDGLAFEAPGGDLGGYVNNFSVSPEPGSAALFAAAGLGLLLRRGGRGRRLNAPGVPL